MLIIVSVILVTIILTLVFSRFFGGKNLQKTENQHYDIVEGECCGAHEVCDKETLLSDDDKIIYYQDEELDVFIKKGPNDYSPAEIDQFREILFTMRENEVSGWLKSLQLRGILPPHIVREEALMIVSELRRKTQKQI